jgi:hypothetical protein
MSAVHRGLMWFVAAAASVTGGETQGTRGPRSSCFRCACAAADGGGGLADVCAVKLGRR